MRRWPMKKGSKTEHKEKELKISISKKAILVVVIIILIAVAAYLVFNNQKTANQGDTVLVNYVLKINNTVFDTNIASIATQAGIYNSAVNYTPMPIVLGAGRTIHGFEDAIFGMKEGEKKTVTVPPELAYGAWNQSKVLPFPKKSINNSNSLAIGTILTDNKGNIARVIGLNGTEVIIDFNHPLAGRTLTFDITLVSIK